LLVFQRPTGGQRRLLTRLEATLSLSGRCRI
jgi:hypothetical protein